MAIYLRLSEIAHLSIETDTDLNFSRDIGIDNVRYEHPGCFISGEMIPMKSSISQYSHAQLEFLKNQ